MSCHECPAPLVSCENIGCVNKKTCDKWDLRIGGGTPIITQCAGKTCYGWCLYNDDGTEECQCYNVKGGCQGAICCPYLGACTGWCDPKY